MENNFELKLNSEQSKLATDSFFENIDLSLWQEINALTQEKQEKKWFQLTQKHSLDYKKGKAETEEFQKEELEFLILNHLFAKSVPVFNSEISQRGFSSTSEKYFLKFEKLGNFFNFVAEKARKRIESGGTFYSLVGGVAIAGKATMRNILTADFIKRFPDKKIISLDRDYQFIFPSPWEGDINIIEDVHGLDLQKDAQGRLDRFDGENGVLDGYDLIVYVLPSRKTYRRNLLNRGLGWLEAGKMDLTEPEKEYGKTLEQKIQETAVELSGTLEVSVPWFKEQLKVLRELQKRGTDIAVVDPTEILNAAYGLKEELDLENRSFLEALEESLKK